MTIESKHPSGEGISGEGTPDEILARVAALADQREAAQEERLRRLLGELPEDSWDRLAAEELTASQEANLRAYAQADDEARAALEAFEPLDPAFRRRVAQAVSEQRALESQAAAKVVPLKRRTFGSGASTSTWAKAAMVVLSLTVTLLVFALLRGGQLSPEQPAPLPVPDYALQVEGAAATQRSLESPDPGVEIEAGDPEISRLRNGGRLRLALRPATEVEGEVEVRSFLTSRATAPSDSDAWRAWQPVTEIADSGAVRLEAIVGEQLDVGPGSYTLAVLVGRPEHLPSAEALPSAGRCGEIVQDADACWRLYCLHVDIQDGQP